MRLRLRLVWRCGITHPRPSYHASSLGNMTATMHCALVAWWWWLQAWIFDAYSKVKGFSPAVVTGAWVGSWEVAWVGACVCACSTKGAWVACMLLFSMWLRSVGCTPAGWVAGQ